MKIFAVISFLLLVYVFVLWMVERQAFLERLTKQEKMIDESLTNSKTLSTLLQKMLEASSKNDLDKGQK